MGVSLGVAALLHIRCPLVGLSGAIRIDTSLGKHGAFKGRLLQSEVICHTTIPPHFNLLAEDIT